MAHFRLPRSWGIALRFAAAAVAVLLVAALLVHTPPVRRAVLQRVVATAAERLDVTLHADTLRYNLLALSVSLTGVTLTAAAADTPFLTAETVAVTVPRRALFGPFALDRVTLDNARIAVVRRADGTTNLPAGSGGDSPPAALPLERLVISPLAITFSDEVTDLSLSLPHVTVDVGPTDGTVGLARSGTLRQGNVSTPITSLEGGVSFDGRIIRLADVVLAAPEGRATLNGTLALLVDEPRLDLSAAGAGDLARLVRWGGTQPPLDGTIAFDATAAGPFEAPSLQARIESARVVWEAVTLTDLSADLAADAERLQVPRFAAATAGGRVAATLDRENATGRTTASADWADVDVGELQRALTPGAAVRPAARATGSARLDGAGADLAGWTIHARTRLVAPAAAASRVPINGMIALDVENGRWQGTADAVVASAPLEAGLAGSVNSARLSASTVAGTLRLRDTEVRQLLDGLRSARLVEVPGDAVTRGRLTAEVAVTGTLEQPRLQIAAAARELVTPEVSGVDIDLTADGTLRRLAVEARIRQGTANAGHVTGTVWPDDERLDARVVATLGDLPALVANAPLAGTIDLDLTAAGPFDALAASGSAKVADARYQQAQLGRLDAAIEIDPQAIRLDIVAPELSTRARASLARLGARHAAVELEMTDADLARLLRGTTTPLEVSGRVSLTARADGPLDDWRSGRADLLLTRLDARAGELPVGLHGAARASYDGALVTVSDFGADIGDTRLSIAGSLPLSSSSPSAAVQASLTGQAEQVLAAVAATGLVEVPDVAARGSLALLARVTGSIERPTLAADLDVSAGELTASNLPPARDIHVRARVAEGWVDLLAASARWQDATVTADGRLPLRLLSAYLPEELVRALPATTGGATLNAYAASVTPAVLAPFLDPASMAQIQGDLDASLRLEASALDAAAVSGEARLDRLDVSLAGLPIAQREPTRVTIDDGVARVVAWDWTGQGATLAVQGEVRLTDRQAALLAAGRIDLRTLAPFVGDAGVALSGTLAPRVSVFGALDDPRIDGELALTDGEVRLRDPRIVATGVNAFAVLTPSGGRTTNLRGTVNGGTLAGAARFDYGGALPWTAELTAMIGGMGLEFPEGLRSELNADLTLALRESAAGPAGTVTGTVAVARSAYREPLAVITGLLSGLRTERLAAVAADPDALTRRLDLNVRVLTDTDVVVDNNLAQLELGGDLRIIGTAAEPSVAGRALIREGGQLFLGRNVYTVEEGTIDFTNPVTIEPNLNVRATTRAGGYDIELSLTGTPETLSVDLRAPASDLGQADIASLLLTGRRLDDVAGAEAQIVGEQVLGYLSGDVLGLAGRAVGLDNLRLGGPVSTVRRDPAAVAADTDPTSRLTFGKTFAETVEITFSQSLRQGASTWIVDYQPFPQLDLRLVSDDDNLRTYEFRHNISIGGGEEARRNAARANDQRVRIVTVGFSGDAPLTEAELRDAVGIDPGDTFDVGDWQRGGDRLESRLRNAGFLEARVAASRSEQTEGVALAFEIRRGPATAIHTDGYTLDAATRSAIEDAWALSVFDDFLREEADAIVRRALAADGFLQPQVAVDVQGTSPDTKTMTISVSPGVRAGERRLVIASDDQTLARELEQWSSDRGLRDEAWSDPSAFQGALAIELRARGYLNATVVAADPRVEDATAVLVVTVDPGPRYTISAIVLPEAGGIPANMLQEAARLEPGAPYDPAAVDDARERVARAYRREGFAGARVAVEPRLDDSARTVALRFTADPGDRDVLRRIEIRGSRSVDEEVISRALALTVGQPLATDAWLQARSRLFQTSLFRRVDVSAEPFEETPAPANDGERPMRVVVTVQEWPALRVRYGFQLSEERPDTEIDGRELAPGLSADVTRRTLFGRALTVGAAAEYQPRERLGRIFANAPTLAGWPLESLLALRMSRETFTDASFVTDTRGISWEQRLRIRTPFRVSYSYSFERNRTYDTGPPDPFVGPFDLTVNIARISTAAVFDTRDDPTDATRGMLVSFNLEHAPTTLGSDVRFLRQVAQAYRFQPWKSVVFASAARFGLANGHGGQVVIPSERFYAGGARSVRGVAEDSLGPRDFDGTPAGGEAMVVLNQELRVPILWRVRGVAFFDAGTVFERPSTIDLSELVTSAGAGLRITTPLGLLRVDFARPWHGVTDQSGRWTFGIGQAF